MSNTRASATTKTKTLTQYTMDKQEAQLLPTRNCLLIAAFPHCGQVANVGALIGAFFGPEGALTGYDIGCDLEPIPVS